MYFTVKGLLSGIPIYAYPAQLDFVKALTPPGFSFHPFPYPPWYALATFYLGWLPIQVAARAWFFLNIGMLSQAVWLMTPGWHTLRRILACLAAILFIPAFGLLVVGQYSAPVLLGAALFTQAARNRSSTWAAAALLLMTFKPHIGGLLILAGLAWLLFERTAFARRALLLTLIGGLVLAGLGFLADPAWPLTYVQSLVRYREIPGVQTCGLCAGFAVNLIKLVTGQSNLGTAAWLSVALALPAGWLVFGPYRTILKDPAALMAVAACLTLLLDPYLLNYDFVLLLLPLFWLYRHTRLVWPVYFLPWASLALGHDANILLAFGGLVTFILILRHPIDASSGEAYNQITN